MATNKVYCSYQEIVDMHTETNHATAIGIHTPVGDTPRKMFSGFFDQFKKYKYLGCSISFVPVATLPADPSQVAISGGDYSIDPRDLVNPIMFHGCHGDDMGTILNKLYGDGAGISESMDGIDYTYDISNPIQSVEAESLAKLYYKALTDNTWKKAHPQKGFRKSGLRPLVYQVAANRQITPNNFKPTMQLGSDGKPILQMGDATSDYDADTGYNDISLDTVQFFTPRLTGLGWIDTRMALTNPVVVDPTEQSGDATEKLTKAYYKALNDQIRYTELPKLYMGVILLAPAYKTELYFRVIFNHHFAFKDFRGISFKPEITGIPSYTDATDDLFDPVTYPEVDFDGGSGSDPEPEPGPEPPSGAPVYLLNKEKVDSPYDDGIPITIDGVNLVLNIFEKLTYQETGQSDVNIVLTDVGGSDSGILGYVYSIANDDGIIGAIRFDGSYYVMIYKGKRYTGTSLSDLHYTSNLSQTATTSPTVAAIGTANTLETDGVTVGWQVL